MSTRPVVRQRPRAHDGQRGAEVAVFEATEQLLQETSMQDLTVAQIIKRAGLSRANFYHYFASKYDVLVAMIARLFDDAYAEAGPWQAPPGKTRAKSMDASMRGTIDMWSGHGEVICAAVEQMHSVPAVAAAWKIMLEQFVGAVAEQITHERANGAAPDGAPPEMIATMLVGGVERTFYVGSKGLDERLPSAESAVESILALTFAAIYGNRRPVKRAKRRKSAAKSTRAAAMTPAVAAGEVTASTDTAATILQAVNDLLQEHTLDELSVAQILERADASRGTFYFYFGSKDDAFVALFKEFAERIASGFELLVQVDRNDPARIRDLVADWLDLDEATLAVARNAVHEWPRRPELRRHYLDTMTRMTSALQTMIEADRAAGIAVDGPPAAAFAAVCMWTIERTVAGAMAKEEHLEDLGAVTKLLGELLVSAIYGL
ncbi:MULTISPECIES: TetR/AcrR family transcriptional regulator [unclassified Rhodococcus (in: high G+C Gram-positive bacteria)]|uniref:TetR/AcrR family transcriptional regulator n=1 Tax=unclassified Rhodococcus (in: high G+C Gram-positive bacteria) TaxID=192944 RepID=UPI00289E16C9|nr:MULTISPECIES: TetR/AcrR family transcriptional regulator [unclassified Rhodococcus (in: high G+C Gram-positive bacteria)]